MSKEHLKKMMEKLEKKPVSKKAKVDPVAKEEVKEEIKDPDEVAEELDPETEKEIEEEKEDLEQEKTPLKEEKDNALAQEVMLLHNTGLYRREMIAIEQERLELQKIQTEAIIKIYGILSEEKDAKK